MITVEYPTAPTRVERGKIANSKSRTQEESVPGQWLAVMSDQAAAVKSGPANDRGWQQCRTAMESRMTAGCDGRRGQTRSWSAIVWSST